MSHALKSVLTKSPDELKADEEMCSVLKSIASKISDICSELEKQDIFLPSDLQHVGRADLQELLPKPLGSIGVISKLAAFAQYLKE